MAFPLTGERWHAHCHEWHLDLFRLKGDAMMETRLDKPSLSALVFKRAVGWAVLTAQFLLKKDPDLRW